MYENKTEYLILNNMLDKVTSPVSKVEGTLVYDALSPVANELAKHYIELDSFIRRAFVQTSNSGFLDLRGAEYGLERKQPTKATTDVVFAGTDGTIIPEGFLVQTVDGKQFRTTRANTIASGTATTTVMAVEANAAYNIPAGTLTQIPIAMSGVTSVMNPAASAGGTGVETDSDFRLRILDKVRNPGSSGNINHYIQWAMEVDGVGAVKVFPLWNGNGTVKVAVIDSNRQPATQAIVDAVKLHIETERPVGASVTVESGVMFNVTVSVNVDLDGSATMDEVKTRIQTAIVDHFRSIAFKQSHISYPKLSAIILAVDGVADHTGLKLNDISDNLPIPGTGVATLDTLIIS